jgi:hypothetical protein
LRLKVPRRLHIAQWLKHNPDDAVLRWVFALLLAATATVLALDYAELGERAAKSPDGTHGLPALAPEAAPALPRQRGGSAFSTHSDSSSPGHDEAASI